MPARTENDHLRSEANRSAALTAFAGIMSFNFFLSTRGSEALEMQLFNYLFLAMAPLCLGLAFLHLRKARRLGGDPSS